MDAASLQHLEVTHNVRDGGRKGTLLEVLDHTATAMGGRLLRKWLEAPLLRIPDIVQRQDAVEEMVQREILRNDVKESLERIYDFERILTRIETGTVNPKDLVALRESLSVIPTLRKSLEQASSSLLRQLHDSLRNHEEVYSLLCRGIKDDPGVVIRNGGVIRDGFSKELDDIRAISANSRDYLRQLEEREKEKTGIKLKIGYTKVLGIILKFPIPTRNPFPITTFASRLSSMQNGILRRN